MRPKLALIGFGEAAQTLARAADWGELYAAFDVDPAKASAIKGLGLRCSPDAASALKGTNVVLSLVTADQALPAAREYAPFIEPGAVWFDMNSVAPATKRAAAEAVEERGAHYIDAALLSPVKPAALNLPVLLSGAHGATAQELLGTLGFQNLRTVGSEIGRASAIKMIRSVMVKGVEALTAEMMEAAAAAGVADEVLASLDASETPSQTQRKWPDRAAYNLERMASHGARRAAEMEEAAATLRDLGVEPTMTLGTVQKQSEAAKRTTARKDAA